MPAPHIDIQIIRGYSFPVSGEELSDQTAEAIRNDIFSILQTSIRGLSPNVDRVEVEDTREAVGGEIDALEQGRIDIVIADSSLTSELIDSMDEAASSAVQSNIGLADEATFQDMRAEKVRSFGPDFADSS